MKYHKPSPHPLKCEESCQQWKYLEQAPNLCDWRSHEEGSMGKTNYLLVLLALKLFRPFPMVYDIGCESANLYKIDG